MSGNLNMSSKIQKNIKELQSIVPNPKYKDGLAEVISLYKSRKIENIKTAIKIAEKFSVVGKGEAGAAKSGTQLLKQYRGKQSATGKLERQFVKKYTKTYFVKGNIKVKSQYVSTNAKTKVRTLNPKVFIDDRPFGIEVQATSPEDAQKQWKIKAAASTTHDDGDIMGEASEIYVKSEVQSADVSSVTPIAPGKSEAHTPMRKASAVRYGFIPEDAKHQTNEGTCVIDNFVGIYGPLIKHMTKDYFVSKVNTIMNANQSCLDPEDEYDITEGITPSCLLEVCKECKISVYAYDITNNCFSKHVTKARNYPALVYYAVGGHMYWISDQKYVQSLIKKAYDKETKIVMEHRNNGLYQVHYKNGKEVKAYRFDITMGAKNAQTSLFWDKDNVYELPLSFYTSAQNWGTSPSYPPNQTNFDRLIPIGCFECHG